MNHCVNLPGPRAIRLKATGSLSVALRAEPGDLAVSAHPIIDVGLALETGDFSWFGAWVLSDDSPVIIRVTNGPEGHFGFCHAALCRQCPQKRTRLAAGLRALRSRLLFEAVEAWNGRIVPDLGISSTGLMIFSGQIRHADKASER
jgi:hypothetical protein